MPLRDGGFLRLLRDYRVAWLAGRYGSYKTALSVMICIEYLERGWVDYAVGNFPAAPFTDWGRIPELRDVIVVLDEGGNWLNDKSFNEVTAFLRKRNIVLLIPSVQPPNLKARTLNLQMVFNANSLGIDWIFYACKLDYLNIKETYRLNWRGTKEIFGLYDTEYAPTDGDGIIEWIVGEFQKAERERKAGILPARGNSWAQKQLSSAEREQARIMALSGGSGDPENKNSPALAGGDGLLDMDALRGIAELQTEAARKISEAVPVLSRIFKKKWR